jgi:hypothetical protein
MGVPGRCGRTRSCGGCLCARRLMGRRKSGREVPAPRGRGPFVATVRAVVGCLVCTRLPRRPLHERTPTTRRLQRTTAGLPLTTAGLPLTTAGLPLTTAGLPLTTAGLPLTTARHAHTTQDKQRSLVGVWRDLGEMAHVRPARVSGCAFPGGRPRTRPAAAGGSGRRRVRGTSPDTRRGRPDVRGDEGLARRGTGRCRMPSSRALGAGRCQGRLGRAGLPPRQGVNSALIAESVPAGVAGVERVGPSPRGGAGSRRRQVASSRSAAVTLPRRLTLAMTFASTGARS